MTADWIPFHRRLAKGPKRGLPRAVRFVLLELSLEARATRGVLDLPPEWSTLDAVHSLLGGDRREIEVALNAFVGDAIQVERTANVHTLTIPKWDEWAGPKTGAERQADYRERQRVTEPPLRPVTGVTPTGHNRTGQERTKQDKTDPTGALAPDVAGSKGKRGCRLPEGWTPSPGSYAKVLKQTGQTEAEALGVLEEFRDFWRAVPGQKGCKLDWDATFRNRLREVHSKRRSYPRSGKFPSSPPGAVTYRDFKDEPPPKLPSTPEAAAFAAKVAGIGRGGTG